MTDFGSLALIDDKEEEDKIALPGVRKGDVSSRSYHPEIRVSCVRFSPTGKFI